VAANLGRIAAPGKPEYLKELVGNNPNTGGVNDKLPPGFGGGVGGQLSIPRRLVRFPVFVIVPVDPSSLFTIGVDVVVIMKPVGGTKISAGAGQPTF